MMKKVPKRRFKGFLNAGDWEQRKLEGLCDLFTDGDWIESKDQCGSGVRLIQTGNIGITEYLDKPDNKKWISDETFNQLHCKEVFPGDILISRLPEPAGRACIIPHLGTKMITAVDCTIVRTSTNTTASFLVQYLSSQPYFNEVNKCLAGGTRQRISRSALAEFKVLVPSEKAEQDIIGKVFDKFDILITLHQRKLEKLQATKKALLYELFPIENSRRPKRRFKGFTGDWEQRKLGDIATITGGGTPSTNISEYWNGDIDWYSPVEIGEKRYASGSIRKITKLGLEKSSAKILPVGTVLFTSRAGIGNTAILQVEGCTNQGFQSITPNSKELDTYFLYTMTPKLKRYGEVTGAGSTFVEVSSKQMEQMNLMIPSLDEQKHVSQLFKVMDDAITLHQRKLEKLKNLKAAYLNEMFV